MTIAFKPTATETVIEQNGSDIATLDSNGLTMASGMTLVGDGVGKILQVVQTVKTDTFSTTSTTPVDITGLTVSITPSSTSSKILVMANPHIGNSGFAAYSYLCRDSTTLIVGDTAGIRPSVTTQVGAYAAGDIIYHSLMSPTTYLDSPSTTSTLVYKIKLGSYSAGQTSYCNRTHADRNTAGYDARTVSTITVMEVAG